MVDPDECGEGPLRRADRNMLELLQELRVAQTGVQILFAFLLSLSFTERSGRIDEVQRWTYVVTLLLSVLTGGLLVGPAAAHPPASGGARRPRRSCWDSGCSSAGWARSPSR